jgi:hypothetical protein
MSFSYVVFEPARSHWIRHILDESIGHCYIIEPFNGKWLVLNKSCAGLDFFVISEIGDKIHSKRFIKCEHKGNSSIGFTLNTCVSLVKSRLGIVNPFIQTPKQLYKYLRKHYG